MKNIGIITFQFAYNYGAVLQCWALQKTLLELKSDVSVINYCPDYHLRQYSVFPFAFSKTVSLARTLKQFISSVYHLSERIERKRAFKQFSRLLKLTIKIRDYKEFCEHLSKNNYDTIICGSDQIWNYKITNGELDPVYFGYSEMSTVRRIGYAISIGDADLDLCANELERYAADMYDITAREKKSADVLQQILKKSIPEIPDPTLLIDKEVYSEIAIDPLIDNYILIYLLDDEPNIISYISFINEKLSFKVIDISPSRMIKSRSVIRKNSIGPLEFLGYIKNASYILTNSFHGTVFSIIFNKQFVSLVHKQRGERIRNLLSNFGLLDRLITNNNDISVVKKIILYNEINNLIKSIRDETIQYIKEVIE